MIRGLFPSKSTGLKIVGPVRIHYPEEHPLVLALKPAVPAPEIRQITFAK